MKSIKKQLHIVFFLSTWFFVVKGNAQELQTLIDVALKSNPKIEQFNTKYKRISEKKNESNTLPNTQFGLGVFASTPETRTGAQRFKASAKQMLPWFGTITARENYLASLADATYQDIVIVKRKITVSVSQSYYKLYEISAKQQVLVENKKLLEIYKKLALTSVSVGKASAVDVLKLQIRQNELQQQKEVLYEQFSSELARLNKLLNRDATTKIKVMDSLMIPKEIQNVQIDNLQLHPELIKYDKIYASVEKSQLLNNKERKPMLGFGLDYVDVEKRPNMNFEDNGKDILMPMVSFSIPIFNKKYKSISKQNILRQQEITSEKQERYNVLETQLQKAISKRNSAIISNNTQLKNLAQAKSATQILIKSYETGTIDFNDVLDIQELQLKFQMNSIISVVNYYTQSTIINYLIQ